MAALAIVLVDALKGVVPDFQGKCEACRSASVSEVLLKNKLPVFYCASSQFKAQAASQEVLRQYEAQESNLFLGVIYGCAAAVLGAIAWGGVALAINRIFLWGGVLIGYMIAWALIKGMGKINLAGQIAIGVLTVASVIAGDFFFYTGAVVLYKNMPLSLDLVKRVMGVFWNIELKEGVISILFALFGAGYAVYHKARKPKFDVVFKPLGARAKAAGA